MKPAVIQLILPSSRVRSSASIWMDIAGYSDLIALSVKLSVCFRGACNTCVIRISLVTGVISGAESGLLDAAGANTSRPQTRASGATCSYSEFDIQNFRGKWKSEG